MNKLQILNYGQVAVRMMECNGEPWWVLADVCRVLELKEPHRVAARLDEDEHTLSTVIDRMGCQQDTTIINESGLYSVILWSDKPEAKAFKRWITHEVLPSIRKRGMYAPGREVAIRDLSQRMEQLEMKMKAGQVNRLELPQRTVELLPVSSIAQLLLRTLQDLERAIPYAFGEVQISNRRLCQLLGIRSIHTLAAARRELVEAGYIFVSSGVKGKPSIYQLRKQ